jgi:hypothetical protein
VIEDIDIFHYTLHTADDDDNQVELIQSSYIAIIFTVLCWVAASEEAVLAASASHTESVISFN